MDGNLQPDILFTTHSNGVKLFLNKNGISYQFQKTEYPEGYDVADKKKMLDAELQKQIKTSTYRMDMELVGANSNPIIETEGKSEYFENFYLSHCPNGVLNVPTFTKITYKEVYPNIDWVIYTTGQEMKYDFIVHPVGDPTRIKVKYNGATEEICPGRFSYDEKVKLAEAATLAHTALHLDHYSRSDFIVKNGEVYFLEVNTLPGLTDESLLPKAAAAIGLQFTDLVKHLVETSRV